MEIVATLLAVAVCVLGIGTLAFLSVLAVFWLGVIAGIIMAESGL